MQTLGLEYNFGNVFLIILCTCLFVVILTFFFIFLSDWFINYNEQKEEERLLKEQAENKDRELITQSKSHHRNYSENFAKEIKEKQDFKVDFSVNTENSIVRTEVVYAE